MNDIKKGDIVVRKSYGKDIIFRVINILNKPEEKIAVLNGVIERIEADSKIADLELVDKQKVKDILRKMDSKIENRIEKSKQQWEDRNYRIGVVTNQTRAKEKIITGEILHLDGDRKYSEKSYRYYRKLGLNAIVKYIPEYRQPRVVYQLLESYNPDILVNVEIRGEATYIYVDVISGIGGYPVGIQGKGLLMLSGGIDSPVAGYLSLKRGVDLECLYFESLPHTSLEAREKVLKLASILNEYSLNIKVHVVPFTNIQETIYKNAPDSYIITIMRRMMYRIADRYSKKIKCKVIINGESIGQVASQTLTSMVVINSVTNKPIIRPVACMDKLEIIDIANKINTYQTSILPYEDCCTIFLPKHPVINPELDKCIEIEKTFNYEELINETINNIQVINLNKVKNDLL